MSDQTARRARAAEFAALHHGSEPLLLPNAWDHASAALLAGAGFRAVATTSLGVAAAAGRPDGARVTREETLRVARSLGGGGFLLSVDAEDGYSDDPDEVAAFVVELALAGAVGVNLEDGRSDGTLTDPDVHAAKIAAVKAVTPEVFVNARTDTHWLKVESEQTVARLAAYRDAGADGVFVPGLGEPEAVRRVAGEIGLPLNLLYRPGGPNITELGELGVRRVSLGSLLYRIALGAAARAAETIRDGDGGNGDGSGRAGAVGVDAPAYAEVQRLSEGGVGEKA